MVSGRAHDRETRSRFTASDLARQLHRPARRKKGGVKAGSRDERVGVEVPTAGDAGRSNGFKVFPRVDPKDRRRVGGVGELPQDPVFERLEGLAHCDQSFRAFGMPGWRFVVEVAGVVDDEDSRFGAGFRRDGHGLGWYLTGEARSSEHGTFPKEER